MSKPELTERDATRIAIFFLNGNQKDVARILRDDGAFALDVALALIALKHQNEISRLRNVVRAA
mgnify:CR=1 FL=1|jgi:hypothetical protein